MWFRQRKLHNKTREHIQEAVGAAFSASILQHNSIINSSSNIPSLCHTDEWCSNEPVLLSGFTAVIRRLYAATSGMCMRVHVGRAHPLSWRWVTGTQGFRNSEFIPEGSQRSFWNIRSLQKVWEQSKEKRERQPAGPFISKAPSLLLTAICGLLLITKQPTSF